ncbi:MAG: aminofutalosine synthase MqnE [Nitrospiraceae bacterium]|nr:MAG: aminofutalosine synthase MqnE [Nitrospiraceae bacterium]
MPLDKIEKKILSGKRITPEDALDLFNTDDIYSLGRLANHVAVSKNGNRAYFIQNHHINPTNICVNRCKFCAFSRSKGDNGAYELSIPEIIKKLRAKNSDISSHKPGNKKNLRTPVTGYNPTFSEVHIVGGLHPDWSLNYYLDLIRTIKTSYPNMHIKAFTAVEIDYFSKISGLSLKNVLLSLKEAGLDTMPGGGAEIFNSRIRKSLCPEKISGSKWLGIMETAHSVGIKTNATMLYGHVENYKHRVEHMQKLRNIQDKTGGFQAFIPLAFHPLNTKIDGAKYTSGIDDLKTVAVSRLFLDNIPHIKAYWIMLGEKIAQLALIFGADDLDGTIIEEKITHSAGALSGIALTKKELVNLIQKAGKVPVERDSFYMPVLN